VVSARHARGCSAESDAARSRGTGAIGVCKRRRAASGLRARLSLRLNVCVGRGSDASARPAARQPGPIPWDKNPVQGTSRVAGREPLALGGSEEAGKERAQGGTSSSPFEQGCSRTRARNTSWFVSSRLYMLRQLEIISLIPESSENAPAPPERPGVRKATDRAPAACRTVRRPLERDGPHARTKH